jgi:site-specific recombinase XerD
MKEKGYAARTLAYFKTAIKRLSGWMTKNEMPLVASAIDGDNAARFKLEALERAHPKTANKLLSGLRSYWKWLQLHRKVTDNAWTGLSFPKERGARHERERPFTDDEVAKLFNNNHCRLMRNAMGIAALSGMRKRRYFSFA